MIVNKKLHMSPAVMLPCFTKFTVLWRLVDVFLLCIFIKLHMLLEHSHFTMLPKF